MNKIATTIEQSKKLVEILPLESADMHYWKMDWKTYHLSVGHPKELQKGFEAKNIEYLPCWSLAALLGVLPDELEDNHYLTLEKKAKNIVVVMRIAMQIVLIIVFLTIRLIFVMK